MAPVQSPKLIARNVAAVRRFADASSLVRTMAGNPVSTRLESGIGNCFPGLECDLRNLERRFFPFLEVDIGDFTDCAGRRRFRRGGARKRPPAACRRRMPRNYSILANELATGRAVFVSRLSGSFGVLGQLDLTLDSPSTQADFPRSSTGPNRRPPDAWTAVRLLTEGTDVTLVFVNDGGPGTVRLTAERARYLDDNGTLSAAFLPGELSQSLCSPWTHDFRDCGCFYWASNHPDIVQPVLPANTAPDSQPWNAAVAWERRAPRHQSDDPAGGGDREPAGRTAPLRDQQPLAGAALRGGPPRDHGAVRAKPGRRRALRQSCRIDGKPELCRRRRARGGAGISGGGLFAEAGR